MRGCGLGLQCRKVLGLVRNRSGEAAEPQGTKSSAWGSGLACTGEGAVPSGEGGGGASRTLGAAGVGVCGHGSPLPAGAAYHSPWPLPSGHTRPLPVVCSVGLTQLPCPEGGGRLFISSGSLSCREGEEKVKGRK